MKKIKSKPLSRNDLGLTGSHQAGICVPRQLSKFFPELNKTKKNPRKILTVYDIREKCWEFNYIYYNNKFFGGTRNEYRLTRMTRFLKENDVKIGDRLKFEWDNINHKYHIKIEREGEFIPKKHLSNDRWKKRKVIMGDWEVDI